MLVDAILALLDSTDRVWDLVVTELEQTDEELIAIRPITLQYPMHDRTLLGQDYPVLPLRVRVLLPVVEITIDDEPPSGSDLQIQPGVLARDMAYDVYDKDADGNDGKVDVSAEQ